MHDKKGIELSERNRYIILAQMAVSSMNKMHIRVQFFKRLDRVLMLQAYNCLCGLTLSCDPVLCDPFYSLFLSMSSDRPTFHVNFMKREKQIASVFPKSAYNPVLLSSKAMSRD